MQGQQQVIDIVLYVRVCNLCLFRTDAALQVQIVDVLVGLLGRHASNAEWLLTTVVDACALNLSTPALLNNVIQWTHSGVAMHSIHC